MAREEKKEVSTSFADLLKDLELKQQDLKPSASEQGAKEGPARPRPRAPAPPPRRPSSELTGDDRAAYLDAMGGVLQLREKGPAEPRPAEQAPAPAVTTAAEAVARAQLAALVGGGVQFEVKRDGQRVRGWRLGTSERAARKLEGQGVTAGATLDLHGLRVAEAERQVVRFIQSQHERGVRRVRIVHGKGSHSEGGVGVLGDHTVRVLTEGGAAPRVLAFVTAPARLGGSGALIVQLTR